MMWSPSSLVAGNTILVPLGDTIGTEAAVSIVFSGAINENTVGRASNDAPRTNSAASTIVPAAKSVLTDQGGARRHIFGVDRADTGARSEVTPASASRSMPARRGAAADPGIARRG